MYNNTKINAERELQSKLLLLTRFFIGVAILVILLSQSSFVQASINASEPQYIMTIGNVTGSAVANYVYTSIFNPVGSGKAILIRHVSIQMTATAAAAYQTVTLRKTTAASLGTQISASDIFQKNSDSNLSIADVRYAGPTVTLAGGVNSRLISVVGPGALGSLNGYKDVVMANSEPITLLPGEGVALYQEAAGSANQKVMMLVEWDEQNTTTKPLVIKDEYMMSTPVVAVAGAANYVYASMFNPTTSNKTAIVKRISIDVDCSAAAVYTNNISIRRTTAASAGTLITNTDIPQKYNSSNTSLMEIRHTGVTVTFAGALESRIATITPCGLADQIIGHKEYVFNTAEEKIILKQGEGVVLYTESASNVNQRVRMFLEWEEVVNTSTPASQNDLIISYPPVAVAAAANYTYQSFYNPVGSGKVAIVKRIEMRVDATGAAVYQPISIRKITAASLGSLITQANVPKKHSSTANTVMELRYAGPTVTFLGSANSTILNVIGPGAVGQMRSRREFVFDNHEKLILQPGEGIAMFSEAAGSVNQNAKFSIEWEEEPVVSTPSPQNEYMLNIGEMTGSAVANYNYTAFFNPINSNKTAIIHRFYIGVDAAGAAVYIPFSVRRINASAGGIVINASDITKKNNASNFSAMSIRYNGPAINFTGTANSRLDSVQSPGAVGSATAPQLSGSQETYFPGEDLILQPGEGVALYQEGAGSANFRVNLFVVWQEVSSTQTPATVGDGLLSVGPITGSLTNGYVYGTIFNPSNSNRNYVFKRIGIKGDRIGAMTAPGYIPLSIRKISSSSGGTLLNSSEIPEKNTLTPNYTAEVRYGGPAVAYLGGVSERMYSTDVSGAVGQNYGNMETYFISGDEAMLKPGEGLALYQETAAGDVNMAYRMDIVWNETIIDFTPPSIFFNANTTATGIYPTTWIYASTNATDDKNLNITFIRLYNSTGALINFTNSTNSITSINFTNLSDGVYYLNATANDSAGNYNWTQTITITLDDTPPNMIATVPINNTNYQFSDSIEISANATDLNSVDKVWVNISLPNGTTVLKNLTFAIGTKYNTSYIAPILSGRYNVSYYANDTLGNLILQKGYFNVVDNTAPSPFNLTSPQNNTFSSNLLPVFTWQQTTELEFKNYTLLISQSPTFAVVDYTYATLQITNTTYPLIVSLNNNSKYYWRVIAYDVSGNSRNSSGDYIYTTDAIVPTVNLNLPSNLGFVLQSNVLFNYTPNDTNLVNCSLYGNFSGAFISDQTNTTPMNNQPNFFSKVLSDGTYIWNVRCYDAANNNGFALNNYTVYVDTSPPIINLESPLNNTRLNTTNNITFYYDVTDAMTGITSCSLIVNNTVRASNNVVSENVSQNLTAYLNNSIYIWSVNCTDNNGFVGASYQNNLSVKVPIYPVVTMIQPLNNSGDNDGTETLKYNVTGGTTINCSLILNGNVNQTNNSVNTSNTQSFNLSGLSTGRYNWSISCINDENNTNLGNMSIQYFDVILSTNFAGSTTDFSTVNTANISGLTIESPGVGKIVYTPNINLSNGANLNNLITIGNNIISVDSITEPRLNFSATLTMNGLSYVQAPAIYGDGVVCSDCSVVSYNSGTLIFGVTHFTSYITGINANMMIWDESDPQGGNILKRINNSVKFFANYTNKTSGAPINGAACNVSFSTIPGSSALMNYNASSQLYEYNRTFNISGSYTWNVSCNGSVQKYERLFLTDSITIYSNATVSIITIYPNSSINVSINKLFNYSVNVSCTNGFCGNLTATLDPSSWWDSNWKYRRQINLTISSGSTPKNYQLKLILNSSNVGANWNWSNECIGGNDSRIKIVNGSDERELGYWIENCSVAGQNMSVWVNVDQNITTSNYSIYLYYGNAGSVGNSNGTKTFDLFDDFSGDLSKWNVHIANGVYPRIENGVMVAGGGIQTGAYGHNVLGSDATYSSFQDGIIEGIIYLNDTNAIGEVGFRGNYGSNTGYKSRMDARSGQGLSHLLPPYSGWNFVTGCTATGVAVTANQWLNMKIVVVGNIFNISVGAQSLACTDNTYSTAGEISLQNHFGTATMYDNIRVRKYSAIVPTYLIGSEQSTGPKDFIVPMNSGNPFYTTNNNPINYSIAACLSNMNAGDYCVLNWTVNSTGNINTLWFFYAFVNGSGIYSQSNQTNITIINDTIAPRIINATLNMSSINQSDSITLNVTINDETQILSALATLKYPNGTIINYSLNNYLGNLWKFVFSNTNSTGMYNFTNIIAYDQGGNVNITSYNSLTFNVTASPPGAFNLSLPINNTESNNLLPNLSWLQTTEATFANYNVLISDTSNFSVIQFTYSTNIITNTSKILDYALDANKIYYWKVVAYDVFGSYTNSTQTFVYITDLVNPTVILNTPATNTYSLTHNVRFNYTPNDANTLSSCALYGNFSGSWALNQTNNSILKSQFNYFDIILPDGIYAWNVGCTDKAGNFGFAPANYTILVDTTPPYIQLISPSNNTYENNTNNEVFTANATDTLSNIGSCEIIIDNVSLQTQSGLSNGVWFNFTRLVLNGNHTWSVNCTDTNGFKGASFTYKLNVNVTDKDPPLIALNYPAQFYYLPMQNVTFNYTPQDATGLWNCSIYLDNILNKTTYFPNVTNLVPNYFNITSISEGKHNWSIVCYDNGTLKNKGISSTYNFTIDLTNPVVSLNSPSSGAVFNYSSVLFNYTPSDINLYSCSLYDNFTGLFGVDQTNTTPINGQPNFFSKFISDGVYSWNVQCSDGSGRSSFAISNYTLSIDTTPPYYSSNISSPSSPAIYGSSTIYVYNITWNDNFGVNLVVFENNFTGVWQNTTVSSSFGNIYSINFTGLSAGNYGYRWYAYDSKNNQNYTILYSYDVVPASSSINLLLNGTNGNISIKEGSSINISSSISTPNSGYIELYINGVIINSGTSPISNVTLFSYPGNYNVSAYYPATQNYLSTTKTYFVWVNDTTPPNITLLLPSNNSIIGSSTVTLQYLVQDASNISNCSLYINNTLNQTSNSVLKNVTQIFSADFVDGNYSWKITCIDIYNNIANSSILKFTERQTANMTVVVSTTNYTHQQGEQIVISSSTKDSFGNPLSAYVGTGIIYSNTSIITIPWFNGSWNYRVGINITERNNTNLSDYQINMSINTSGLVSAGKMLSDCSDMRFADETAKEIPYWIESGCNSSNTKVWIKMNLSAGSNRTIYLYYGNTGATSNSNGANVFDYYDDGTQTSNWTIAGTAGQSSAQGLPTPSYYATSTTGSYMYRNASLTTNRILEFNVRSDGLGNFYFLANNTGAGQHFRAETRGGNNVGVGPATSWNLWSVPSQTCAIISTNTWYTFKLVILDTTVQAYVDGSTCGGAYTFTNNGPYIGLVGDAYGATYNTWWDNIRVRKYSAQEPTAILLSGEQTLLLWNYNSTSSIDGNFSFIFDSTNQSYGNYSIVSLASAKNFYNNYNYTYFNLGPDITPPVITLLTPTNFQKAGIGTFNFTYMPYDYNLKNCTMYINSNGTFVSLSTNTAPLNNLTDYFDNITLGLGVYVWNVLCYDINGNNAFAFSNYTLNVTGPDMTLNSSSIYFSNVVLTEGSNITIYANITNSGLSDELKPFTVQFYLGDPNFGGAQISSNITIANLTTGEIKTINTTYLLNIGVNNIFVSIDRNNSVNESDESNNKANNSVRVAMYQYYHGNITANLLLGPSNTTIFFNALNITNFKGNVFIADVDSVFSFTDLQAIGRNKNNNSVNNDFSDLDSNMNTSGFIDSINAVWANNTNIPLLTADFNITPKFTISNVPIVYSSNNSNFTTGILWDTADDLSSNFQYDTVDKEDVVFVTSFDTTKAGSLGDYLYEIKVPALLRSYKGTTDKVALYYNIE